MLHGIADEAGQKRESEGQSNPHPPAASSRTGSSDDGRLLEHIFARLDVSGSGQVSCLCQPLPVIGGVGCICDRVSRSGRPAALVETASIQRKIEVILNQEVTEDEIRIRLGWNAPRTHIRYSLPPHPAPTLRTFRPGVT
eukprot:2280672-Rhodomonas_salina.2